MEFDIKQVLGTIGAGAVGFAVGFYGAFFVILSIWGLEFEGDLFPIITIGLASVAAGVAMALTVRKARRTRAVVVSLVLGAVLIVVVVAIGGDVGAIAVGGLLLVTLAGFLVRGGVADGTLGGA